MIPEEIVADRVQKVNGLKHRIDLLSREQCNLALKHLVNRTHNKDGTPSMLIIDDYDDVFGHTMIDAIELAEELQKV